MATKTWNGASDAFTTDADWGPTPGTPGVGDTAIINAGTVTASGVLSTTFVQLASDAGNSPTLILNSATIQSGNKITINAPTNNATLQISGASVNAGNLTLQGSSPFVSISGGAGTSTLTNTGGLSVTGSGSIVQAVGNSSIVNNGVLSYRAASGSTQTDSLFSSVSGTGQIRMSGSVVLSLSGQVSSGQTVVYEIGAASLTLNSLGAFNGSITGFSGNDLLSGIGTRWDNVSYQQGSGGGNVVFTAAGNAVASIHFNGSYSPTASFGIVQSAAGGALSQTDIRVTDAQAPARFNFNDQVTGVLTQEQGIAYSDPNVPSLQYRYIYTGNDAVVIGANVPNVFINGGSAGDALNAYGGSNVLDGGGGSNFLVGASGADGGHDQFYVDERGNTETWSTLVNFHVNDSATIFGFKAGVSTQPIFASDGAAGYTGVTIHSEINGAGTGVTGSVTFAGVSQADFNAKFTMQTGTLPNGGPDYLLITRTIA